MQTQLEKLPQLMEELSTFPKEVQKKLLEGLKLPGQNPYGLQQHVPGRVPRQTPPGRGGVRQLGALLGNLKSGA